MTWLMTKIKWLLAIAAGVFVAIAVAMIRKSGGDAERAKQAQADLHAANTVATKRTAAQTSSDNDLDKAVDRWTKP